MTLVLRSDVVANQSIGNVFGINGPQDFSGILDFNQSIYRYRSGGRLVDVALTDALVHTRASTAEAVHRDGTRSVVAANTPRVSYLQSAGLVGLLMEGQRINYFRSSKSPATQTISLPRLTSPMVLTIEGSGAATITGDVSNLSGVATVSNPATFSIPAGSGNANVTITLSGLVTFAQLEMLGNGEAYPSSRIETGSSSTVTRQADSCRISDAYFAAVKGSGTGLTVVTHSIALPRVEGIAQASQATQALLKNSADSTIWAGAIDTSSVMRVIADSNAAYRDFPGLQASRVSAIGVDGATLVAGYNGASNFANNPLPAPYLPTQVHIGSGRGQTAGGIIARMVFYPRILTRSEVSQVTGSWS